MFSPSGSTIAAAYMASYGSGGGGLSAGSSATSLPSTVGNVSFCTTTGNGGLGGQSDTVCWALSAAQLTKDITLRADAQAVQG